MTFLALILIVVIILAVIGLGWQTFTVAVLDGFNRTLDVSIPIIKNLTQEANAVVETLNLVGPEEKEKAIDDCMISLKAENPREQHLLDCDILMPLVPRFIEHELIYNTTDIDQKFDEYMTLRALDIPTDEEIKQQVINGQLNLTPILVAILFAEEKDTTAATPIVNNTEDLMIYDENTREGIMNQLRQECGANNISGGPLTYDDVINRENMTQTQKECVNKILSE